MSLTGTFSISAEVWFFVRCLEDVSGTELVEMLHLCAENTFSSLCVASSLATVRAPLRCSLSVCLFANEENLASLYYMRARMHVVLGWQ
jgi:hypothetical protein